MKKTNVLLTLSILTAIGTAGYFALQVFLTKTLTKETMIVTAIGLMLFLVFWIPGVILAAKENKKKPFKNLFSEDQINRLKLVIMLSPDSDLETKKACFALIDSSEGLTKPVYFTSYAEGLSSGIHDMRSSGCVTHLTSIMKAMGTEFEFTQHSGEFNSHGNFQSTGCETKNGLYPRTIWLSNEYFDENATGIEKDAVDKIEFTEFPGMESDLFNKETYLREFNKKRNLLHPKDNPNIK